MDGAFVPPGGLAQSRTVGGQRRGVRLGWVGWLIWFWGVGVMYEERNKRNCLLQKVLEALNIWLTKMPRVYHRCSTATVVSMVVPLNFKAFVASIVGSSTRLGKEDPSDGLMALLRLN